MKMKFDRLDNMNLKQRKCIDKSFDLTGQPDISMLCMSLRTYAA